VGGGAGEYVGDEYTSHFIFRDTQLQVTTRHTRITKATQLKSLRNVTHCVSYVNQEHAKLAR
jgi:hypothetical protein